MPQFARYIGIDHSGAKTAESSAKGLGIILGASNLVVVLQIAFRSKELLEPLGWRSK